jgi:hypothetical protein
LAGAEAAAAAAVDEAAAVDADNNSINHRRKKLIVQKYQITEMVRHEQLHYGGKNNDSLYLE